MIIIRNWNECMATFHSNTHSDKISVIKIKDSYGLLIDEGYSLKFIYYNELLKVPIIMNIDELLSFIEQITWNEKKQIGCNERADIFLNIICKKAHLNYLSELKSININEYIDGFMDCEKYKNELQYIADYLKS